MPFTLLDTWLNEEKELGAPNPRQAVLATVSQETIPHSRVVAIREINADGLLFFTQKGTRKVKEMQNNPHAVLTFWLELKQREIIIEGDIETLIAEENENYWRTYPREAQIRFHAYAPTSGQPIAAKKELEEKRVLIARKYQDQALPMSADYCGFRLKPKRFVFYTYQTPQLSDVFEFALHENQWIKTVLSP